MLPLLFLIIVSVVSAKRLPPYFEKCYLSDPNVKQCTMKAVNTIAEHLSKGIPEFGFPSMDPLILPQISLENGDNFRALFKNMEIYNVDQMRARDVDFNFDQNQFGLKVHFPSLRLRGNYSIQGKILFLQLNGDGPVDGNFTNVDADVKFQALRYKKRNKEFLKFNSMEIVERIQKPVLRFEGLFKNNPELTEQTNKIVNENIDEILIELKPSIHVAIEQTVLGLIGRMFEKFSLQELFPE